MGQKYRSHAAVSQLGWRGSKAEEETAGNLYLVENSGVFFSPLMDISAIREIKSMFVCFYRLLEKIDIQLYMYMTNRVCLFYVTSTIQMFHTN